MTMLLDVRRVRARQAASSIMALILDKYVPFACRDQAYEELHQKFIEAGAEIITDTHRVEAGLPTRGPEGWTFEELEVLEKRRFEQLIRPLT